VSALHATWALAVRPTRTGVETHVVPMNDLRDHDFAGACWCSPLRDERATAQWVHNSMDRRELTIEAGITQ